MKSLFSDSQVEDLTQFVETRSGKSGLLRYAGQLYAKKVVLTVQGYPQPYTGFQRRAQADRGAEGVRAAAEPARGGAEPVADRPQLLAVGRPAAGHRGQPDPRQGGLPRALRRLPRAQGRRQGAGGELHVPAPGRLHRQGRRLLRRRHRTGRLLLPDPARLDRHGDGELRRAPVGRRHLARGAVREDDPERHAGRRTACPSRRDYITWQPSKELLAWVKSRQKLEDNASFEPRRPSDPFMQEAMRVFPGLSPADQHRGQRARHRRSA